MRLLMSIRAPLKVMFDGVFTLVIRLNGMIIRVIIMVIVTGESMALVTFILMIWSGLLRCRLVRMRSLERRSILMLSVRFMRR